MLKKQSKSVFSIAPLHALWTGLDIYNSLMNEEEIACGTHVGGGYVCCYCNWNGSFLVMDVSKLVCVTSEVAICQTDTTILRR